MSIGKIFVRACGKSETSQAVKEATNFLKSIVSGKPAETKKDFYRAVSLFCNNPSNKSAEKVIMDTVENSSIVLKSIEKEKSEFVSKAVKTAETSFPYESSVNKADEFIDLTDFTNSCRESIITTARQSFEYTSGARKKLTALPIADKIITPVKMHYGLKQAVKQAKNDLKSLKFEVPEVKISSDEIAKEVFKDIRHENNVLLGRTLLYPINKFISAFISKDFKNLLSDVIKLPKNKFGAAYYEKLVNAKGLSQRAPKSIVVTNNEAKLSYTELITKKSKYRCQGGFNPISNTVEFTKEFSSLPKWVQTNLVTHELKHFEQADTIIRTFGIERYISALKNNMVKSLKASKKYADKSNEQLQAIIDDNWAKNDIERTMREAFKGSINAPKINPASEMGKNAEVYLKANENYVGIDNGFFISASKDYLKNPLEIEAYKTGNKSGLRALVLQNLNLKSL